MKDTYIPNKIREKNKAQIFPNMLPVHWFYESVVKFTMLTSKLTGCDALTE